jgi:hypothetical protein
MGKGLKVYLAALTRGIFTIKVADMAADRTNTMEEIKCY